MPRLRRTAAFAALLACLGTSACHSDFVQTSIVNHTGGAVQLIEVDYPDASFGTQEIAAGATYHYRFKILDSGSLSISFTGPDHKPYSATGPSVHLGQQGRLSITIDPDGRVEWTPTLSSAKNQ